MNRINSFLSSVILLLVIFCSTQVNAQYLTKKTMSLELAKKVAAAAEAQSVKDNLNVIISLLDEGGNLIYFERMDNAQLGSIEISMKKANTALFFKRSTKSYQDRIAEGNNGITALQNILPFEGGLPIFIDGELIGSIGVSGATSAQDGVIAQAGVDFLTNMK